MKSAFPRPLLVALVCMSISICYSCKEDDDKGDTTSDTGSSPADDAGTSPSDSDEDDTGSENSEDTGSGDTNTDETAEPEEVTVESVETAGAVMTMVSYADVNVPMDSMSARQFQLNEDWNKIVPSLCDSLGNHTSCPSIECDKETRTATLKFESSFEGCDLNACYFMNQSVSGEMTIQKGDDKTTVTYKSFHIGATSFDGGMEISRDEDKKTIVFTDSSDDDCDGLFISLENSKTTCISGEVTLTRGDDESTSDVVEKRKMDWSKLTISAKGYEIALDGTVIWVEGTDCIGPQSGTVTVSIQSQAKDDEDNPLLALGFPITFAENNKSKVREMIEGDERFKEHEKFLPRDVFCSLPGVDKEAIEVTHGDVEDFKSAEFVKKMVMKLIVQFSQKAVESPKVTALKAIKEGLSVDDFFTKILSMDKKILRFLKAPVKGLCDVSPGTCPQITVTCTELPEDVDTDQPPVHDCLDTDMGYDIMPESDQVPESITLDFTGGTEDGSCETLKGKKFGGKIKLERDLSDPVMVKMSLSDFTVYRTENGNEIANIITGEVHTKTERESEPCIKDEQLKGSIIIATPKFSEEGDKGLSFQKGECPGTTVMLDPLKIRFEDKIPDAENLRDRATEQFFMTWRQNQENYFLSTFYDNMPQACRDDPEMPDWTGENANDAVYYDLPMTCTCPYQGPVTIGTKGYSIPINNAECIELCIAVAGDAPKAEELCETAVCDTIIPEGKGTIELASADMSITLGFSGTCGEAHTCEHASLQGKEIPECKSLTGGISSTPCVTMLTTKEEYRADCFEACVLSTSVDTSGWTQKVLSAQFSSISDMFETLCVTLGSK